ncbi:hypothetical protein AWC14_01485 [Mycobacterium kyorinense]|uniref:Uncharacterized protein n=2 Tax=Mycobacterium kyorinense TaxID=487514 RepID=A0A1X1Y6G0_9MYCO|nr:hypothetical protein AWC14_01485 [Mycobacterium kyorinense]
MDKLQAASVTNPITPEQSRAQAVDAASEIVHALELHLVKAVFWYSSCDDDATSGYNITAVIAGLTPIPGN